MNSTIQTARATGLLLAAICAGGSAPAQTTVRVSLTSAGSQANSESEWPSITPDGRFVVFHSYASNLAPGDTNASYDVFVRDILLGTTERVSVSTSGALGNSDSWYPAISADGRLVAFDSTASTLVGGDTNGAYDVFVRDRTAGTTERVSQDSSGVQGNGNSQSPSISADGRFVAFQSSASNLVAGDLLGASDIFVRDRLLGTTERVSLGIAGAEAYGYSFSPSISGDGRFVAFRSSAANLVPGDTNGWTYDIFVHDRQFGTTERVSVDSAGAEANQDSERPAISANGRFVAFVSAATNLVAGDTNARQDIFVHDRLTGATERVSESSTGLQGNNDSYMVSISLDGRFVAFTSHASNLVAGDTNLAGDAFVRDRLSGTTERVSISTAGTQGNYGCLSPTISADGRLAVFMGLASNLVSGDTNQAADVFLRERWGPPPGAAYCLGDGTGTACPCGNASAPGANAGCLNSLGTGGVLVVSGAASLGADTLVLQGSGMPSSSALYFQGTAQVNSGLGAAFGDGLRCAGGSIARLGAKANVAGSSQYPVLGDLSVSVRGNVTAPGTRDYQVWYRNAAAFCTPATYNLTNAWELVWVP